MDEVDVFIYHHTFVLKLLNTEVKQFTQSSLTNAHHITLCQKNPDLISVSKCAHNSLRPPETPILSGIV